MTVRNLSVLAVVLALLVAVPALISASAKNDGLKMKLGALGGKTDAGDATELKLKLKNRTGTARAVTVEFFMEGDLVNPFATETYALAAKEKRKVRVPMVVPADYFGRKLKVYARAEGLEDDAKVKVRLGELSEAQWIQGRDMYQSLCGRCHGNKGGEVRGDSLDKWIRDMRNGPGSMPKYDTPVSDIILMREYTQDPNRL